ncbi:hypothetical protein A3Q56_00067 [Intoshia linei]|uniref:Cyclic nucleotide-binding domain-containing protein n=1 Tax=Intoshia linei TaxID=1819745 RepID=A0A177BD70_9BILA|nr:hypothetical protein A3Q56_00067 [Intoshia linei]
MIELIVNYLIYIYENKTAFIKSGEEVKDGKVLRQAFVKSIHLKISLLSIIPTDLFYFYFGMDAVYMRLNRLLLYNRLKLFFDQTDSRSSYPDMIRIFHLILNILIIIHWNGCFYFQMSRWIGFGSDGWVYSPYEHQINPNNITFVENMIDTEYPIFNTYIFSFYWSMLTLTTIGDTPRPENNYEYVFNTVDFLVGVIIFATIVGNVGNIIMTANENRLNFQNKMDGVKKYMKFHKLEKTLEKRVVKWFEYVWNTKKSIDDEAILKILPNKLRQEIALDVHLKTLQQVNLFKDCDPGLLAELVLKLKLTIFSPSDYVCRKGDIGREMYIIKKGSLNVVSPDGETVFATLKEGVVFGEISILNIPGNKNGCRRTASIKSVGYSDIFTLDKEDLWNTLKEYPEAKELLILKGTEQLKKDGLIDPELYQKEMKEQMSTSDVLKSFHDQIEKLKQQIDELKKIISKNE